MTLAVAKAAAPAKVDHDTRCAVEEFLYRQADLLDRRQWRDFLDLFADDGVYWIPAEPHHTTWKSVPSIFVEDKDLMAVRMKRLLHPRAWSQRTSWGTNHVVGNVIIDSAKVRSDALVVNSRFHMMEYRRDEIRHFAGSYEHHLVATPAGYRIRLQRVDLVNAEGPYEYVLQAWV